jgi:hypothetical protein
VNVRVDVRLKTMQLCVNRRDMLRIYEIRISRANCFDPRDIAKVDDSEPERMERLQVSGKDIPWKNRE